MFSSNFQIGNSAISHLEETAKVAFKESVDKWLDATIDQMRSNFAPFVLDATTLAIPPKTKQFKGGIWPFGSIRGVKIGQTLNGGPGHYAKVVASFPKYSLVTDISNPTRTIPAGERYSLTLVDKPTDRPEPSVELSWLGNSPSAQEGDGIQTLSANAMVNLFDNYLSKGGGIKVLPPHLDDPKAVEQFRKLSQEVSNHSNLVEGNLGTFERDNFVVKAATNPDRKIEIGVLERYHGTKTMPDGTIQNYYRVTLAASVEERTGSEENPLYAVASVVKHTEEHTTVEAPGIRELDPSGTYLTLYRNAVINLAKKVRETAVSPYQMGAWREATVGKTGVDWKGEEPGAFAPLSWFRPGGQIIGNGGESLGSLYKSIPPSHGYLNKSVVANEKLEAGDILRYQSTSQPSLPIVGLELVTNAPIPSWLPGNPWLQRLAGDVIGKSGSAQIIPLQERETVFPGVQRETVFPGVQKISIVKVSALRSTREGQTITFTGQWRCQVRLQESDPAVPPLLQFGIQSDSPVTLKNSSPLLQPLDTGGWGLNYTLNALKALADVGTGNGIKPAFSTVN